MVNWLSTWQDVESPRRHTSGHAHEGLFRLGWWGVKTHPFHGLECPAEHNGEFQLRTTSIHLFLFPDCGHNVTSSCCLDSLPQCTIPSCVSRNKPLSLKSLFVTVIWKIANTQMDAGPLGHYVRLSLLLLQELEVVGEKGHCLRSLKFMAMEYDSKPMGSSCWLSFLKWPSGWLAFSL